MLQDLIKKLEAEHGIAPEQGNGILNTIVQHIKEKFPMVGQMLDNTIGSSSSSATNTTNVQNNSSSNETSLQQLEELAKSKLGSFFGGSK